MIRLGVRVRRADAELALAQLLVLAPAGVEECDIDADVVEYAVYGAPGELPELGAVQATVGDALVEVDSREVPDDWAQRWRDFHRPVAVYAPSGRAPAGLYVRPPWEAPPSPSAPATLGGVPLYDIAIDPGQAFGTGAHATTRLCLELMLELAGEGRAHGPLVDVGCGSGVLAIAAARLGFDPVVGLDHEAESVAATVDNAACNGVAVQARLWDLRHDPLPDVAGVTVMANLLAPLLAQLAASLTAVPAYLVAGGLLTAELDAASAAFTAAGLGERARRCEGEWGALALAPLGVAALGQRPLRN